MTETYLMWVAGEERPGQGELLPIEDPATKEIYAHIHTASPSDVSQTLHLAHQTYLTNPWSSPSSAHLRASTLSRLAEHILPPALPRLIALESRQTGRPIREMSAQIPSLIRWFHYYASLLRTAESSVLPTQGKLHNFLTRKALGVVVQITPFNHPLLICVKKLAPALAAGNSVVVKPSELAPLTAVMLGGLLKEAGVPDGVFSVLPGLGTETGRELVRDGRVRMVDVTGGTKAGKEIGRLAGGGLKRFVAELGGKAPLVVFDSGGGGGDGKGKKGGGLVRKAVNGIAFGSFVASGQTCIASTRIVVENSILEEVVGRLKEKCEGIVRRMGSPANKESMMGPLISGKQLGNVVRLVDEAVGGGNAEVVTGGKVMTGLSELDGTDFGKGYFYPPTVLVSKEGKSIRDTAIWREEAFGPVIVVIGFDTEEEAIELANDTEFGLGAGIWTDDLSQAFRVSERIEAGMVWVNTHHRNDPSSPWGGVKTESGVGSENGIEAYHSYTTIKSTIVNYASTEETLETDDWFRDGTGDVRYG